MKFIENVTELAVNSCNRLFFLVKYNEMINIFRNGDWRKRGGMAMTIFWLIIVAVMLVLEIFTMGLTTIWFSAGAVIAAIASACHAPLWLQILLFTVISVAIMLLVRPFAMKFLNRNRTKTNVEELQGQQLLVIETIDNQKETGHVKFRDLEWMARSTEDEVIDAGEQVVV
jgi:membrane protein implicated in regulation of membrane protease activity